MPVEHQFLFLAQAVETFHRRTRANTVDAEAEHEQRLFTIFFSVPARLHEQVAQAVDGRVSEERILVLAQRIAS